MKKYILSFLLISIALLQGYSQSMLLPKEMYADLKSKGKLKENVHYIIINDSTSKKEHPVVPYIDNKGSSNQRSSDCSCMVPLDNTFNVAEFLIADAPEYRNDDGSTDVKIIPFNFCFYGASYNELYINNNGNISFGDGYYNFSSNPFPNTDYVMVAPFWADVDTRNPASGLVYYKITPTHMIVKWESVGYYESEGDKLNTFQLIITDGNDPILPLGDDVGFCYGDMQWTTGAESGGVNGFGGTDSSAAPATVGINKGDGVNYIQMGRFSKPGSGYDGGYGKDDGISWLDHQSFYFNACSNSNIPPIASGLNNCDTLTLCGLNDTLIIDGLFLAPEISQNTTVSVGLNGITGASVLKITNGNSASAQVQIVANSKNVGNNVITFTATDNGTPVGTTIINVNVFVDTSAIPDFNPHINGKTSFCIGDSVLLNVIPTNYDAYVWDNGSSDTAVYADHSGVYWVTATLNGCNSSTLLNVTQRPLPTPEILGPIFTCSATPTTINVDSASLYTSYHWSNGSTGNSTTVGNGVYSLIVTDIYGCVDTTSVTIATGNPTVVISGSSSFCAGDQITLTADPSIVSGVNYLWSNSEDDKTIEVNASGTYSVTINYNNGCTASDDIEVEQYDAPDANFTTSPNGTSGSGTVVHFTDKSIIASGAIVNWYWNFGDGATSNSILQNPAHAYAADGIYLVTLAVQSNNGCWDSIRYHYTVATEVSAPNVFTPNGDGNNDFFVFNNLDYYSGTTLTIYDRWGNKIYESSDYKNNWGGDGHADGIYYYVLKGSQLKQSLYGFVQLMR